MKAPPTRIRPLLGVLAAALLAVAMAMLPGGSARAATQICSNQTGTNGGMFYQSWSNGQGSACITLNSANSYSTTWSGIGDFVDGVGWNPGSSNTVSFSSSLSASGGTSLISLYGWSTNPLVEYYITENYVGSPNTAGTYEGQVTSDGGTYNIYEHQQVNQPCITGNSCTFEQYLAYRTSPVSSGTITTQNFINAWASHGMNLGTLNYQILATESYGGGSGNSSVTVNSGGSSGGGGSGGGGSGGGSGGSCTATLSAGSSGSNWYNLNVSVTGSSTWTVTVNMVSPAVVYSTWNVNATYPSEYVMKATPNGSGNNWGFTVSPNGQWTWPSVSCSTG
ncbi:MAG TPA: glycoside hydrolase family 11 protein [Trebonia sp.]|nr:glycoside hydrolase family 11 protein [Trebonia sp.]